MKKILLVGSLFFIAACGSKTYYVTATPAPTEETTTTSTPTTTRAPITTAPSYGGYLSYNEQGYIDSIYSLFPDPIYLSDADLIETGRITCTSLRAGMTVDQMLQMMIDAAGGDPSLFDLMTAMAASAIVWFCPDQAWKMDA